MRCFCLLFSHSHKNNDIAFREFKARRMPCRPLSCCISSKANARKHNTSSNYKKFKRQMFPAMRTTIWPRPNREDPTGQTVEAKGPCLLLWQIRILHQCARFQAKFCCKKPLDRCSLLSNPPKKSKLLQTVAKPKLATRVKQQQNQCRNKSVVLT